MRKIIKRFTILTVIIFVLAISVTIYGKNKIKHIDYQDYIEKSIYAIIDYGESLYRGYPELKNSMMQDRDISTIDDLVKFSEDVLVIEAVEDPTIYGSAIVNTCTIKEIIKGKNLKLNDQIQVYDLMLDTQIIATIYLNGATPLQKGKQYLVFLNQAPRPSIPRTYLFSNAKFGHIRLDKESSYLKDYENYSMPLKDTFQYDYIFLEEDSRDESIKKYEKIVKEALDLLEKYN